MHHPHHHHRHQSAPRFLLAAPAGVSASFPPCENERLLAGQWQTLGWWRGGLSAAAELPSGERRPQRRDGLVSAERRSCINTDQRSAARLPAAAITSSRGRGEASPSLLTTLTTEGRIITSFISRPGLKISPPPPPPPSPPRWFIISH